MSSQDAASSTPSDGDGDASTSPRAAELATGAREPAANPSASRRFPVLTRDTARPEGGGRAAAGDAPAPYRQWPLLMICGGVITGLLVTVGQFRTGTVIIGVSMLVAGLLRWALPSVGMLAVRSRFTDLLTYGLLGVGITMLALLAQPKPVITIPFLDDILHFSVR